MVDSWALAKVFLRGGMLVLAGLLLSIYQVYVNPSASYAYWSLFLFSLLTCVFGGWMYLMFWGDVSNFRDLLRRFQVRLRLRHGSVDQLLVEDDQSMGLKMGAVAVDEDHS